MSDVFDNRVKELNEWYSNLGKTRPLGYRIQAFFYGCYSIMDLLFPKPILEDLSPLPKYQLTEIQKNAILLGAVARRQIADLEAKLSEGSIRPGFFVSNWSFYNDLYTRARQEYSKK